MGEADPPSTKGFSLVLVRVQNFDFVWKATLPKGFRAPPCERAELRLRMESHSTKGFSLVLVRVQNLTRY
jgi:hypothetical protein